METGVASKAPARVQGVAGDNLTDILARFGTVVWLVAMVLLFSGLKTDSFPTISNLVNVLNQVAVLAVVAAGLTVCLVTNDFDLSVGSMASLAGALSVGLILNQGLPAYQAIAMSLAVGVAGGLANGIVISYLRISSFVATLASASIFVGFTLWYSGGKVIYGSNMPPEFAFMGKGYVLGIPMPVIVMAGFLVVFWLFLTHSVTGRRLYAIGGNEKAAILSGINVRRHRLLAFALAGLAGATAGMVLSSRLGAAHPQAGEGFLLQAFAAAFLGSVSLRQGQFHIWGTLIGVLIIGVAFNGLTMVGVPFYFQSIFQGAVLVLAVALSGITNIRRR